MIIAFLELFLSTITDRLLGASSNGSLRHRCPKFPLVGLIEGFTVTNPNYNSYLMIDGITKNRPKPIFTKRALLLSSILDWDFP